MRDTIADIIRQAGEIILASDRPSVYEKEGHANFVTQTDIDVQAFLIRQLSAAVPQAAFLAEEQEAAPLGEQLTFIIDPIDGTTNFMRGRRTSAISVGLVKESQPVMGFIYQPWQREMYSAVRGEGAYVNGQRLQAARTPFRQAIVNFGTAPYQPALWPRSMALCQAFLSHTADLRRGGSAALDLCDIASGRADVYWELELSPWDYAAGSLLVTEAGGVITDCAGADLRQGVKTGVLAASPACHGEALALLRATGA